MLGLNFVRTWLVGLAILISLPALAGVDEALLADGWSEVLFDGKTPNRFEAHEEGGVEISSEGTVSLLQRPLLVDLLRNPVLTWRWRVDQAAPPTDLGIKGGDDRSLAVYIAFPFQPEEASFTERMKRSIVESFVGAEAPGRVLVYVWGGEGKRGDHVPSPYLGKAGMTTILRPAASETGVWQDESIDIAEDYRASFGSEPPAPISIAIGADSDDTMSKIQAVITGLTFIDRPKNF